MSTTKCLNTKCLNKIITEKHRLNKPDSGLPGFLSKATYFLKQEQSINYQQMESHQTRIICTL